MRDNWNMLKLLYRIFKVWRKYPYLKLACLLDMANHQFYVCDEDFVNMLEGNQFLQARNMYEQNEYARQESVRRKRDEGAGE